MAFFHSILPRLSYNNAFKTWISKNVFLSSKINGTQIPNMTIETKVAAKASALVGDTRFVKCAIPDATKIAILRNVSAHTCYYLCVFV